MRKYFFLNYLFFFFYRFVIFYLFVFCFLESEESDSNEKVRSMFIVNINFIYLCNNTKTILFCLEPILASDEIHRAQSLDELHTRLAAIRGKNILYLN